ncbi:GxxExxY protein [bacterium]|nr:GxxExxY protein [bacterium]
MIHKTLTDQVIRAFYKVYNTLEYGFLEKVYENALIIELRKDGLEVVQQMPIKVYYENQVIGEYFADLCVENKIIIELKSSESLSKAHEAQLINYLKATQIEVGILLNFGKKPEFSRKVYSNKRRQNAF